MRGYILTDRERGVVERFMETGEVSDGEYGTWTQVRHQFRQHREVLTMDLALLEKFIETPRRKENGS